MAQESTPIDPSGSDVETAQAETPPWLPRVLRARMEHFEQSAPGRFWGRLSTVDFMTSSFAFAALAVISVFPLFAVGSTVLGGDVRQAIVERMGLNPQATRDVEALIASGNRAVATLTWVSAIVLVLGGIGMASTLSTWYHRMYDRTPPRGLLRHLVYQAAGVAAFLLYISAEVWLFDKLRPAGGRGVVFLLTFVLAVLFWWWSTYMLLYRQVPLRQVFPAGVATGLCITGLGVVSAFFFSGQITSGARSYGPAGVVIALINFLIGFGVCLHAGAVFGRMWNEWRTERASLQGQSGDV